jgi:glyceraldehyde 3-phosphate dehydrogenase
MVKIGINGFGRIGRIVARQLYTNPELRKQIQLVAVNDLAAPKELAFLVDHDSVHGRLPYKVSSDAESITIDGDKIACLKQPDPKQLPWGKLGVDVVLECTGRYTDREGAATHLVAGAKKVIVSAPAKGVDLTVVMGVNHKNYDKSKHTVLSNASCTTNCLAPVAHVLHEKFGIEKGLMTTVHSYTSDQRLLDNIHSDPRRSRTAALNMIPTTTGAAKTVGEVIPALKGKLDGFSVRVPTPDVSLTDLVAILKKSVTKEEVNAAFEEAAKGPLKGILDATHEPLVSSDYIGNKHSSIVDLDLTNVMDGNMVKVCMWYDNEVGFSTRMLDLVAHVGAAGF